MRLQGMAPERPLTHDLFASALEGLGVRVERILIHTLADETFHARLVLVGPDSRHELDSRPSDAIALAIRVGAPIFAAPEVLDAAALASDAEVDDDADTAPGAVARLETTGERIPDARLDVFREFVNSLDVEGKGEDRGPQS
jgi:bifunctional DNase/RNase